MILSIINAILFHVLRNIDYLLYYNDMVTKLHIGKILSEGQAYHAALTLLPNPAFDRVREHYHDFYEWMVPIAGTASHTVNGVTMQLQPGQIVLIRPDDIHSLEPVDGTHCQYINVAFSAQIWDDFVKATGIETSAESWKKSTKPVLTYLSQESRAKIIEEAQYVLRTFHDSPTRLAFSRFWTASIDCQMSLGQPGHKSTPLPPWLRDLLEWSESTNGSDLTIESLTETSGVSFAHLCRTMKQCIGVTPTQYINDQRIKQASYELATTNKQIIDIAYEAGFENLSYFYRRFRQHHGLSPRQYRLKSLLVLSV